MNLLGAVWSNNALSLVGTLPNPLVCRLNGLKILYGLNDPSKNLLIGSHWFF
jgi:hypothetical protein